MNKRKYLETLAFFRDVVSQEINTKGHNNSWLNGMDVIFQSQSYVESVYDDMRTFEKYMAESSDILELGTGSGYVSLFLSEDHRRVKAIDYHDFEEQENHAPMVKNMASQQKAIWPVFHERFPNVEFGHYDGVRIPFKDECFDAVVAYAVLEHVPDENVPNMMNEIRRVLKPGGYFLISYLPRKYSYAEHLSGFLRIGHHARLYGDNEIRHLLRQNDFEIVDFSIKNMIPAYPAKLTNVLFPAFKYVDRFLLLTPLKCIGHNIRVISKKA